MRGCIFSMLLWWLSCAPLLALDEEKFTAQLKTLQNGQTAYLTPGVFSKVSLHGIRFDKPVIIDGQGKVTLAGLDIRKCKNLIFKNIRIVAGSQTAVDRYFAVGIYDSENIQFRGGHIEWYADGDNTNDAMGMTVRQSTHIDITENRFGESYRALVIRDSEYVTAHRNLFRDVRSDGINISGSVHVKVTENTCIDFRPLLPLDHPDCIQFWNDNAVRSNENVDVIGNTILRGNGDRSQGIFVSGLKEGLPNKNFRIEHNLIHQSMGDGIFIHRADGIVVRHNTVLQAEPVLHTPSIVVREPGRLVRLENNITARLAVAKPFIEKATIIAQGDVLLDYKNLGSRQAVGRYILAPYAKNVIDPMVLRPLTGKGAQKFYVHPDLKS